MLKSGLLKRRFFCARAAVAGCQRRRGLGEVYIRFAQDSGAIRVPRNRALTQLRPSWMFVPQADLRSAACWATLVGSTWPARYFTCRGHWPEGMLPRPQGRGRKQGATSGPFGGVLRHLAGQATCSEDEQCPPCRTVSGQVVAVGTIGYRLDIVPPGKPHYPYAGSHYNLYKANQNPRNCQCFWQEVGAADAAGGLPPPQGSIPISPFVN